MGHWHWFTGTVYFISVAVSFYFTEPISLFYCSSYLFLLNQFLCFIGTFLFLTKTRKKPLAVFIINTCLYKKSLLYPTCRGKKILPVAEKLLRHPTFRGKTEMSLVFRRKKFPLNRQKCPFGYLIKSVFFGNYKVKYNYIKAWQ